MKAYREEYVAALLRSYEENFTCEVCGREVFHDEYYCETCRSALEWVGKRYCPVCGRRTGSEGLCLECSARRPIYDKGRSPFLYEGTIRIEMLRFKAGDAYLSVAFAREMLACLSEFERIDCLLPVPMTKKRERLRGYNQAKLLADYLSKKSGIPSADGVVIRVKEGDQQKYGTHRERRENVSGIFRVHDRVFCRGKHILIVDDIVTTGATADELARILLAAGAKEVNLLTAACTTLHARQEDPKRE
ncbi:MAG: ComF family protein [Christensenellaceae bacterium]